ncbi:hypothetical protein JCM9279_004554 [Rhodotorula babjevae]
MSIAARRRTQRLAPARKPPPRSTTHCRHAGTYPDQLAAALASLLSTFGAFLATHQTLSLMSTALVICSLLSPAIILTFSPSGSIFDLSASAITRRGRGELVWELDGLRRQGLISTEEDVCWDRVRTYYDKTGREGGGRRIRVEQVLVPVVGVGAPAHRGTITKGVLHRTLRVQRELERRLVEGLVSGNECLRLGGGGGERCAALSPVGWWTDEQALLRDDDVHHTLSSVPLVDPTSARVGLPLTLSETFVGVGRDRHGTVKSAQQLVLTFFLDDGPFPQSPSLPTPTNLTRYEDSARDVAARAWRQAVHDVVDHRGWASPVSVDPMGLTTSARGPTRHVLLKFLPHLTVAAHPRRLENVIYGVGYLLVTLYVWRYIGKLRAHSKMGLLVTGVVELTASGIMSVSICWLMEWDLGLVPWNLLAFLVLTSGLDNMILVLRAIASTDVNLPVPQRMSVGLRAVGVEMTVLLAVEEVMALGLLWWVEISVMREWIRFGAVVLVVDYFLELTFFSTVLSIDIQRLELADLLVQNPAAQYQPVPPTEKTSKSVATTSPTSSSFRRAARSAWNVLRQRPAKTATVAFLWFINVILWAFYGSEHYLPAACSHTALSSDRPFLAPSLSPAVSRSLRLGRSAVDPASSSYLDVPAGAGSAFWHLVNPGNATSVQVYLEPPVSVQFFTDDALAAPESLDLLSHTGTGAHESSLVTKAALVVLPIAVVMTLLYLLLMYLLKDAELLQAHWGSEERLGGPERRKRQAQVKQQGPGAGVVRDAALATRHTGDVELVASGGDAIVSWAALEGTLQVRKGGAGGHDEPAPAFALDISSHVELVSLVALAVDPEARFVAAATLTGQVLVWRLERGASPLSFDAAPTASTAPVVALVAETEPAPRSPARSPDEQTLSAPAPPTISISRSRTPEPPAPAAFYSLHRDGHVVRWDCGTGVASVVVAAPSAAALGAPVKRWLVRNPVAAPSPGPHAPLLALALPGGRLQLVSLASGSAGEVVFDEVVVDAQGATLTALAFGSFAVGGGPGSGALQQVVAVGSSAGAVAFFTLAAPSSRLGEVVEVGSPVRQIRLVEPPHDQTCSTCGETLVDGFTALVSTRTTLRALRIFTPPTSAALEPCACNTADVVAVARSRSSSTGTALGLGSSPIAARTLGSSMSSTLTASGGRRFSPRKKPLTPTRPTPFNLGDGSPLRPRLPPPVPSADSGSSSSSGSPVQERTVPPLGTLGTLAPPPLATSPQASPPPDLGPLDPLDPPAGPAAPPPSVLALRAAELASAPIDERSGWDVLGSGRGVKVVGLRRRRLGEADGEALVSGGGGERGWEVWSLALGRAGAPFDEGFERGASPLEQVLAPQTREEKDEAAGAHEPLLDGGDGRGSRRTSLTLRRRLPSALTPASATPAGAAAPSSRRLSVAPTIRFSPSPTGAPDLPFSRARPVTPALGGVALTVGLGNQLVVLKAAEEQQEAGLNGFLGWS